jgi:hypothetical protein
VTTDPEPDEAVIHLDRERSVPTPYPCGPDVSGLLEAKCRMTWILLESLESLIGEPLDLCRGNAL